MLSLIRLYLFKIKQDTKLNRLPFENDADLIVGGKTLLAGQH